MLKGDVNTRLRRCVLGNFMILILVFSLVIGFNDNRSTYWRFGPHRDFVLISVAIDNWTKYGLLLVLVSILKVSECIIAEVAHPIIGFNIYNPDKKEITEFGKNELQVYGNTMYLIEGFKRILMIVISITQIDFAIFTVVFGNIASIFTIRMILNEKKFIKSPNTNYQKQEDEIELSNV